MLHPSGEGYLLPGEYGAEQHQHCVSGPQIRKKKMAAINVVLVSCDTAPRCFTNMKSISISVSKSALHSQTDKVGYAGGNSKSSALFIRLLIHLKATYRRAKTITLIVDNYIIHKSRETLRWLKENPEFRVIYQPVYSPWFNRVKRLWRALHETITRNHLYCSM